MSMRICKGQCWKVLGIAMLVLCGLDNFAAAQTTVQLNTGYDHASYAPYPTVNTATSTTLDQYWITIASYPNFLPPAGAPAFVLQRPTGWATALPNTSWIGPRNTVASAAGTSDGNPSYAIFKKCFCLLRGYKDPRVTFTVRADDTVQVWLNSQVNQLVTPTGGNWNGPVLTGFAKPEHFRTGRNCLYVLVEDFKGYTGFDLAGTISAFGLLPQPAAGAGQSYQPCPCPEESPAPAPAGTAGPRQSAQARVTSDDAVLQDLVRIAEARRAKRERVDNKGKRPVDN